MANKIPNIDLWYEPSPFQNRDAYLQKNHNWSELAQYGSRLLTYLNTTIDGYDQRINNMITSVAQPSEVVDARIDSWGHKWGTLKARLDNDEQFTPRILDLNQDSDAVSVLKIRDLSTDSVGLHYEVIKNVASISLPAMGYSSTTVANVGTSTIEGG